MIEDGIKIRIKSMCKDDSAKIEGEVQVDREQHQGAKNQGRDRVISRQPSREMIKYQLVNIQVEIGI
jgi:hypothetical protein